VSEAKAERESAEPALSLSKGEILSSLHGRKSKDLEFRPQAVCCPDGGFFSTEKESKK